MGVDSALSSRCTVQLGFEAREDGVSELVLDARDLAIGGVTVDGKPAEHSFLEPNKVCAWSAGSHTLSSQGRLLPHARCWGRCVVGTPGNPTTSCLKTHHSLFPPPNFSLKKKSLGTPLRIALPEPLTKGARAVAAVEYSTSPGAMALQWLVPSQTAGGKLPYLFTQCQAIHARSMVPCQDTPGAKITYAARVRVPEGMTALMSALAAPGDGAEAGVFAFEQRVPIPSYLLALAVGELESRELGPVSRVWSEPSMVEAGAYEFAETDAFLQAAIDVAGPYVWGRYDLLLLPPSFPYGR